jgi:hypothetical protein
MIKLFITLVHAFLFDENAARRWLRGTISILAVSGAAYAQQAAQVFPARFAEQAAAAIRLASFVCAFGVAAHDAKKRKLGVVAELKP